MASPAVTNLAAKLFAIDPSLTPKQARTLIVEGSTTSEDGRRKLVDQSRTIELARINKEKARGGTSSSSGMGVSPLRRGLRKPCQMQSVLLQKRACVPS
jgi:subtilisin family serine protease